MGLRLAAVLGLAGLAGCDDPADSAAPPALTSLSTQNAGTTTWLSYVADAPDEALRQDCSDWYHNNLCLLESEQQLAAALASDLADLVFLQEMWDQTGCEEEGRPAEVNQEPYVCAAGQAPQPERVLPSGYAWACAAGYPDNCLLFREGLLELQAPAGTEAACQGSDCSSFLVSNPASCGDDGRIAYLLAESASGPLAVVVVHANAGVLTDDLTCRAQQLQAIEQVLQALPGETSIAMAGDFNLDPALYEGEDAQALQAMVSSLGLQRWEPETYTHRISQTSLDLVWVRGAALPAQASCAVRFADDGADYVMFDHGMVSCAGL